MTEMMERRQLHSKGEISTLPEEEMIQRWTDSWEIGEAYTVDLIALVSVKVGQKVVW